MKQQLNISSEYVFISSSVDNIDIKSNKNINTYSGGSIIYQTGDPKNEKNSYIINSQNIILGLKSNNTIKLEAVPKSDELIKILSEMLDIMNQIVITPDGAEAALVGDITLLKTKLTNIKSKITKTY
jgi:hypothetical protein